MAAQAFHWFDPEWTREEFKRILRPDGYVALMWNERQLDNSEFLRGIRKVSAQIRKRLRKGPARKHHRRTCWKISFVSGFRRENV